MNTYIAYNFQEAIQWEQEHLQNKTEGLCILFHDKTMVQLGNPSSYDIEAINEYDFTVWQSAHKAGTIVCFPGDISFYYITKDANQLGKGVIDKAISYLKSLDLPDVELHNNDILISGHKVASWAEIRLPCGMVQSLAHFSINVDVEVIKKVCTKNVCKNPGSLSEYGVTTEMLYTNIL